MKKLAMAVYLSLAGCTTAIPTVAFDTTPKGQLDSMLWLAGSWVGPSRHGTWEAHYTTPQGGTILGASKDHYADRPAFTGFERFEVLDGKLAMYPYPNGRPVTAFPLVELDRENHRAVFENPKNDFPQRFEYWRVDGDTLVIKARSLTEVDGKFKGFILELKRL